jgi:phosphatidylglycerol:prolipoprotein diacylglycerol transferase
MNLFAFINWNVNPEIFSIGPISIRWYVLLILLIIIIGVLIKFRTVKNKRKSKEDRMTFAIILVIGIVIAVRLLYWVLTDGIYEIFSIGPISIRWYGLLFSLAFIIGYQIMYWIYKNEGKTQKDLEVLTITMIIGTVVGARLGHCLFYEPAYYLTHPIAILKVWEGGLASHGAAIGIILSLWYYSRKRKNISLLWILDRIVIVVALSGLLIRTGNFMNSEIIGKPSGLPWAVVFMHVDNIPRHPAQLYEAICYLGIFIYLFFRYKKYKSLLPEGQLFGLFLILIFTARFLLEFLKKEQVSFEAHLTLNMGQFLSIPFVIVGIYFVYRSYKLKGKKK